VVNSGQTSQCHDLEDQNLDCSDKTVFILRTEMSGCADVPLEWCDQSERNELQGLSPRANIPTERPPLVGEVSANLCG
jgi:hypothetical protein